MKRRVRIWPVKSSFKSNSADKGKHSVPLTHMSALSLCTDRNSPSSSPRVSTISVPLLKVFPLGSGKISNESPDEVDVKVYWIGSGLDDVAGGRDDTLTVGETRKLTRVVNMISCVAELFLTYHE